MSSYKGSINSNNFAQNDDNKIYQKRYQSKYNNQIEGNINELKTYKDNIIRKCNNNESIVKFIEMGNEQSKRIC